jgi:hypothetical protein
MSNGQEPAPNSVGFTKSEKARHDVLAESFRAVEPDRLADYLGVELDALCKLPPFRNCNASQREEIALRCVSMSAVATALAWHARK